MTANITRPLCGFKPGEDQGKGMKPITSGGLLQYKFFTLPESVSHRELNSYQVRAVANGLSFFFFLSLPVP